MGDESPDVGENNAHLDAPMAFVHDAVDAFPGRAAYSKTIPLSELFDLDATDAGANDTHKKQNIIETVKEAHPLSKIDEAYELFENKRDGVIKVAVEC